MTRYILSLLLTAALCGCGPSEAEEAAKAAAPVVIEAGHYPGYIYRVNVNGCDYILSDYSHGYSGSGGIAHAGNCMNPIHGPDSLK